MNTITYIATTADTSVFWDGPLGAITKTILVVVGFVIVIVAGFKVVKDILGGKLSKAATTIVGAVILAAFMFFPEQTITRLIELGGSIVNLLLDQGSAITDGGAGGDGGVPTVK